MYASAISGKPVIDGDYMGRAFPKLYMVTHMMLGCEPCPIIMQGDYMEPFIMKKYPENKGEGEIMMRDEAIKRGLDTIIAGLPATKE